MAHLVQCAIPNEPQESKVTVQSAVEWCTRSAGQDFAEAVLTRNAAEQTMSDIFKFTTFFSGTTRFII
jgi:hypothetical protein